jgi:hypothetical protein
MAALSLRAMIEQFLLGAFPDCERLDVTLARNPQGRRGDYFFRDHGIIVEQKEFLADKAEKHRESASWSRPSWTVYRIVLPNRKTGAVT